MTAQAIEHESTTKATDQDRKANSSEQGRRAKALDRIGKPRLKSIGRTAKTEEQEITFKA